jgi:hypothetical protein
MSFKKTLSIIQNSVVQFPYICPDNVVFRLDAHLSSIIRPNDENFPSGLSLYVQKLQTVLSCIHPNVSATRPNAFQCSTSKMISFQNTDIGRQLQPSGRCSVPVRTLSLIGQVVQKTLNRPAVNLHYLDAQALIWKLRAVEVQLSGR